jgi:hypothetical protein
VASGERSSLSQTSVRLAMVPRERFWTMAAIVGNTVPVWPVSNLRCCFFSYKGGLRGLMLRFSAADSGFDPVVTRGSRDANAAHQVGKAGIGTDGIVPPVDLQAGNDGRVFFICLLQPDEGEILFS